VIVSALDATFTPLMTQDSLLFWYSALATAIGVVAQIAAALYGWTPAEPLLNGFAFMAFVAIAMTQVSLFDVRKPLFAVSGRNARVVQLVLAVLVLHVVLQATQLDSDSTDPQGQPLVTAGYILVHALMAAVWGIGLEASVGNRIASIIRAPYNWWIRDARRVRAKEIRARRRGERR
jgi:hypothetical protein